MSCPTWRRKSASSCATSISSAPPQRTCPATASIEGSRSGWCNRTACRCCGHSGNRATMRPRNSNQMAADTRRLTLMKSSCLSAFICVHLRPINLFLLALATAGLAWAQPTVFHADTRLVVCHTTVVDKNGHLVTTLTQDAFTVYENGIVQPIRIFHREDVPVSMGLIVDNSGSMRDKRAKVEAAALALVKDSNPDDEVFIVNFNDEAFLDNPHGKAFTNDIKEMEEALTRIDSRGGTAMRDAIRMSIDHLKEKAHKDKKVLVVVTDGNDN